MIFPSSPSRSSSPSNGTSPFRATFLREGAGRCWYLVLALVLPLLALSTSGGLAAQQPEVLGREIQDSQQRLEEIREERARLQREMTSLRSRVQDASGQLRNIERQLSASHSVLAEIDFQVEAVAERSQAKSADLLRTRELFRERQALLNVRLRNVYKRGILHTAQVLLGADSFVDLLNRYRYLQMMAGYDRSLLGHVRQLEEDLAFQSQELQESLAEMSRLRQQQLEELVELRQVETNHQQTLTQFRTRERQTLSRMDQLAADENRLTGLVTELERRRVEEERRRAMAGTPGTPTRPSMAAGDMGQLDWPVNGELLYRFGPERRPNGTVLRWNGIGIRSDPGTPVRAVREGTVAMAGSFEGYGPSVILSHGEGYYTLYLYLDEVGVVEGRQVEVGQVVGTVGGSSTPEGPHLEFQVRAPVGGGPPQAVDPLDWLRRRSP